LSTIIGFNHEDNSFSPDDARAGCRIGAAEANYGLRAGQRAQDVLRSPRKRRSCGVAPRLVHDHFNGCPGPAAFVRTGIKPPFVSEIDPGFSSVLSRPRVIGSLELLVVSWGFSRGWHRH